MHANFDITVTDERLKRVDLGLRCPEPTLDDFINFTDGGGNIVRIQSAVMVICVDALCNKFQTNPTDLITKLKGAEDAKSDIEQASAVPSATEAGPSEV
jgi:hypothetical protein